MKHLTEKLVYDGFNAAGIHKNQTVKYRQDMVDKFKDGELDVQLNCLFPVDCLSFEGYRIDGADGAWY